MHFEPLLNDLRKLIVSLVLKTGKLPPGLFCQHMPLGILRT